MTATIIYLHGFRSSPQSFKAQVMGRRMLALGRGAHYHCPQLPPSPDLAIQSVLDLLTLHGGGDVTLVGSSLGGYYATWLAEQVGCRAVLLNPAVKPPRELEKHIGVMTEYHSDRPFEFKREYLAQLQALCLQQLTRMERYFLLAATGDEVLDWREMADHYSGARQHIIVGSDHGLSDFEQYLDDVLAFCGVGEAL